MHFGALLIIVSTFISTFTTRAIGGFIASRALTGIGQGLAMPAGPVYINEIAPAKDRGNYESLAAFLRVRVISSVLDQLRVFRELRIPR